MANQQREEFLNKYKVTEEQMEEQRKANEEKKAAEDKKSAQDEGHGETGNQEKDNGKPQEEQEDNDYYNGIGY